MATPIAKPISRVIFQAADGSEYFTAPFDQALAIKAYAQGFTAEVTTARGVYLFTSSLKPVVPDQPPVLTPPTTGSVTVTPNTDGAILLTPDLVKQVFTGGSDFRNKLKSGDPLDPSTWPKVELTVGPNGNFPSISQAMAPILEINYNDKGSAFPLAVIMTIDPSVDWSEATSAHYESNKTGQWIWPPFEQTVGCGSFYLRKTPGAPGKIRLSSINGASLYYGKGILVLDPRYKGSDIFIEDVHFKGARRGDVDGRLNSVWIEPSNNEATITIRRSIFDSADTGLLNGGPNHTVVLEDIYAKDGGSGSGYTHNIYVGRVKKLIGRRILSTGVWEGHLLKCRAAETDLEDIRLFDDPSGPQVMGYGKSGTQSDGSMGPMRQASYNLDFPNGGKVSVRKLRTLKGPNASNAMHIAYGEEGDGNGGQWPEKSLVVDDWVSGTVTNPQNPFTTDYLRGINDATGGLVSVTNASQFGIPPAQFVNRIDKVGPLDGVAQLSAMPTFDWTPPA